MTRTGLYRSLFFLLPIFYLLSVPITVSDLAVWTACGRFSLEQHQVMWHDVFSVLPTKDFVYPVGITLIYGLINQLGSLIAVSLFHKVIWFFLFVLMYISSLYKTGENFSFKNIFFIILCCVNLSFYATDRPAQVALFFLLASYLIIEDAQQFDYKLFLKLGLIMVAWVNIHGSWVLLPAMLGWKFLFAGIAKDWQKKVIFLVSLCGVSLLNPFTYKVWSYFFVTAEVSRLRKIDEWDVTNFTDYFPQGYIFFFSVLLILYFIFKKMRTQPYKIKQMVSSPFFLLLTIGFTAVRNMGLFAVVLLPFAHRIGMLQEKEENLIEKRKLLNFCIVLVLVLLTLAETPYLKEKWAFFLPPNKQTIFDETAPIKFADYILKSGRTGPILNDWDYGSYLTYSLPNKILMDARNIIFYESDYDEYAQFINLKDPKLSLLNRFPFDFILLEKKWRPELVLKLETLPNWQKVMADSDTVLFERKKE